MMVNETQGMSTTPAAPYLLRRVVNRAALGVWHHRGGVLLAAALSAALGAYATLGSAGALPFVQGSLAPATAPSTDCADTAMAAIADKSPAAAQRAYLCMDTTFQQRVSEDQFVQQLQSRQMPRVDKLERVGDYHNPTSGGTLVYFALDGGGQSVGYIVYLDRDGKILRIE